MAVVLSDLGLEYSELSQHHVQEAFRRAYEAVEAEQEKLKERNPRNPLLSLVSLRPRSNGIPVGMDFADWFKARVLEHDGIDLEDPRIQNLTFYYLIGAYVDLLREEQACPKFLSP